MSHAKPARQPTARDKMPVRFLLELAVYHYLREIELGDPCALTLLALLLIFVGHWLVDRGTHVWGLRLAVAALVGFAAYQLVRRPSPDSAMLLTLALRSLLAAGLTLGVSWIVLPILAFLYRTFVAKPLTEAQRQARQAREAASARRAERAASECDRQERVAAARTAAARDHQADQQRRQVAQAEAKRQQEQRQAEAARRSDQQASRQHLRNYYDAHHALLENVFPAAMLEAFVAAEMHDGLEVTQLWAICQKKISDLQPLVAQALARQRKQQELQAARFVQMKKVDAEMALCRQKIDRLRRLPHGSLDPDSIADEVLGLERKIQELEERKELLLMTNEEDNP